MFCPRGNILRVKKKKINKNTEKGHRRTDPDEAAHFKPSYDLDDLLILFLHFEVLNIKDTVKILKFGTPQTIAIIVLKVEKFDGWNGKQRRP